MKKKIILISNKKYLHHILTLPLLALAASPAAFGGIQLEEVVVTAQKRAQLASDTPLSLTALDSNMLESKQIASIADLQMVSPGLRTGQQNGINRLFIRGIGLSSFASGADPSSAFHVDGVYVGRPSFQLSSFFDVDRVEVVRGPQGTLYGRNATGGAVNVLTKRPTEDTEGYANLTAGNYDLLGIDSAIGGSLNSDNSLMGRVAIKYLDRSGYGDDITALHDVNDANQLSIRGSLKYIVNDNVDIDLIAEHHSEDDNNYYTMSFGAYPGNTLTGTLGEADPFNLAGLPAGINEKFSHDAATALQDGSNDRESSAVTLIVNADLSSNLQLESITGWRDGTRHNSSNSDGTSAPYGNTFYNEWADQLSQEFKLAYKTDAWDIVGGVYYYTEDITNYGLVPFLQFGPGLNYYESGDMTIDAYAIFGQATYSVLDNFRVTLGGRYSDEERDTTGVFHGPTAIEETDTSGKKSWTSFTPKIGLEYDLSENTLIYASATEGFKSGTFNIGQVNPVLDPEEVTAYEVGFKSRLWDNRLEVTGAAFFYDYTDLQVNKVIGLATVTVNAAEAENQGLELAIQAQLTDNFKVDFNATYLDATFTSFDSVNPLTNLSEDLTGNQLPGAAEKAAGLGLEYSLPLSGGGTLTARADGAYTSDVYFSEFNDNFQKQDSFTKINATIRYDAPDDKWFVSVWGKNITDEYIVSNMTLSVALWGYPVFGAVDPPATYGLTTGMNF